LNRVLLGRVRITSFRDSNFGVVSNFEIRFSDFPLQGVPGRIA
jgi:hypothetical protein